VTTQVGPDAKQLLCYLSCSQLYELLALDAIVW